MATTPAPTAALECIQGWEVNYRVAQNELKGIIAECNRYQRELNCAIAWKDRLLTYWTNIQQTDELADEIKRELTIFHTHTNKVCTNIECTIDAAQILFMECHEVLVLGDELNAQIEDLVYRIDCLGDSNLSKENSLFYACLDELHAKLAHALAIREQVLTEGLDIIKACEQLENQISNPRFGLIRSIEKLTQLVSAKGHGYGYWYGHWHWHPFVYKRGKARLEEVPPPPFVQSKGACDSVLTPEPVFPLNCDNYYIETRKQYDAALKEVTYLKECLDEAKERQKLVQYQHDSLKEALDAAEAAKNCA
ncbi:MAG: hypothetical protein AAFR61_26185 [Bacteroidota bacterium]